MPAATAQLNNFVIHQVDEAEAPRKSLFRRALEAVQQAQIRRAEREIAVFIAHRGGRITDTVEREISNQFV